MRTPTTIDDCGTGGGGGGSITVDQNGVVVVDPATILNFTGDVVVTDAGGGQADIAIGGSATQVQRFKVTVGALTDPDGFDITIPTPMPDTDYVVCMTPMFPTVDDATEVFLLTIVDEDTFTMGALANFADGTILHFTVGPAT